LGSSLKGFEGEDDNSGLYGIGRGLEKKVININGAVSEVRLLEKYKDPMFVDTKANKTFIIHSNNMEWYWNNRKEGIDEGWYIKSTRGDGAAESFMIKDELCKDVTDTLQAEGIEINRREEGEKKSRF
jgi:hypothetical protein